MLKNNPETHQICMRIIYSIYLHKKEQNKTAAINQNNNQQATSSTTSNTPTARDHSATHVTRSRDTFPVEEQTSQWWW